MSRRVRPQQGFDFRMRFVCCCKDAFDELYCEVAELPVQLPETASDWRRAETRAGQIVVTNDLLRQ